MPAYKINISGRVQGVYFRAYTKKMAKKLAITGSVKNCSNGSVEVIALGEEVALQKFIQYCHQGSLFSKVTEVKLTPHPQNKDTFLEFLIIDK